MGAGILLVDDEKIFRDYIKAMSFWEKGDYRIVDEAGNAEEALRILGQKEISIVILDISMPGENGVELSRCIARKYPQISMIVVSSYDDYDFVRETLKNGARDYILKSRLSEEMLFHVLEEIEKRKKDRTLWDVKKELRHRAHEWIFEEGMNPFTSDNSRKAVMVERIDAGKKYSESGKETFRDGICRIFEGMSTDKMDILAIYHGEREFIILVRFYEETSESTMREAMEYTHMRGADSIRSLYERKTSVYYCPFFFSDNSLKSYILHLEGDRREENGQERMQLSLTIYQQKKILSLIEKPNASEAGKVIHEIYGQIEDENISLCFMVTKELLELLERITIEYGIELDFLPKDFGLFEYAREKRRKKLSENIAGLYENVLRELKERQEKERGYSGIVSDAIAYMDDHFRKNVTLSGMASVIGTNSSYLSRVFHLETGQTITEYLHERRVEEAKKRLREGCSMKTAALESGFSSYAGLYKIFKEHTGTSPKEFQRDSKK